MEAITANTLRTYGERRLQKTELLNYMLIARLTCGTNRNMTNQDLYTEYFITIVPL